MDPVLTSILIGVLSALGILAVGCGAVVYLRYRMRRRQDVGVAEFVQAMQAMQALDRGPGRDPRPAYLSDPSYSRPCSDCRHFDLEEGQAMRRTHHAFDEVSRYIPPAEMNPTNHKLDYNDPLRIPQKSQWSEYGACGKRHEHVWGPWSAEKRRLTVLKNEDGTEAPDCWEPHVDPRYPAPAIRA